MPTSISYLPPTPEPICFDLLGISTECGNVIGPLSDLSAHQYWSQDTFPYMVPKLPVNGIVLSIYGRSSTMDERKKKRLRSNPQSEMALNRRRKQNRESQRAYRQRKDDHIKKLQATVNELSNLLTTANQENFSITLKLNCMEEELSSYRRVLFAKADGSDNQISPNSHSNSTSGYIPASSHAYSQDIKPHSRHSSTESGLGAWAISPVSDASSSTYSPPSLSNVNGDLGIEVIWA